MTFLGDIYTNPKYKPMLPPGIAAWTDSSNNENWLAGILGYTRNQFSVYADSKTKKNPVTTNTHVFSDCIGPATDNPLLLGQSQGFVVFKGAKNPALAKLLAQYLVSAPALLGVAKEAPGLVLPAWEKVWDADPFFTSGDPAFPMLRKITELKLPLNTKNGLAFPQKASAGQQAVGRGLRPHRHDAAGHAGHGAGAGRDGRPREDGADLQPAGAAAVSSVRPARVPAARKSPPSGPGSLTAIQRRLGRDWRLAALFLAPMAVLVGGLVLVPIARSIITSTTERHGQDSVFVGLDNYLALVGDDQFHTGVVNSFVFTAYAEVFKVVLGLSAALLLHHRRRGRAVLAGLLLVPWVVPTVVTAFSWRALLDPIFGSVNTLLTATGIGPLLASAHLVDSWPAGWLSDPSLAMPSVILVNVWKGVPFFTVAFLAGLKAIPADLYEAATIDGASSLQRFTHVTLPGLRHVITVTVTLSSIWTFNNFDLDLVADAGRPGRRDRAVRARRLLEGDPAAPVRRGRGGHARHAADHRRAGVRPGPVVAPGHQHQTAPATPGGAVDRDARWAATARRRCRGSSPRWSPVCWPGRHRRSSGRRRWSSG